MVSVIGLLSSAPQRSGREAQTGGVVAPKIRSRHDSEKIVCMEIFERTESIMYNIIVNCDFVTDNSERKQSSKNCRLNLDLQLSGSGQYIRLRGIHLSVPMKYLQWLVDA